ncbi:hypothetical protein [Streptomyces sp. NBC_01104]|uniref:hypothetical protein n=1 Tax=Streptomyces sp. NBC_01104 TaxID=2903750 RepID=UPI00386E5BB1|nr:hypothetical protein OG450_20630 [Streptomyces sp. NBC_01104]
MRRQTWVRSGRRGTVLAASAAVLCLGGALTGCGDRAGGEGYTAVGAAGADPGRSPSGAVAPSGKVTLVPLDGAGGTSGTGDPSDSSPSAGSPDSAGGAGGTGAGGGTGGSGADTARPGASGSPARTSGGASGSTGTAGGTPSTGSAAGSGTGTSSSGGSTGGSTGSTGSTGPASPSAPGSTAPAGPAVLKVGAPVRAAADERWCEKVTVEFRNTGGSPVRSGTVTFATHIIGGLGIDWATRESTAPLPAPIGAGAALKKTYTVCVDAWRVPLGMHVDTRDVTAVWK